MPNLFPSLGICLAVSVASPALAQVTTNNALPIGDGQALIRVQAIYLRAAEGDRFLEEVSFPVVFGYGATRNLALFAVAPLVNRQFTAAGSTDQDFGVSDLEIFARYTVFQSNRPGQTLRIAPLVGLEIPLSDLGSRSVDPSVGLVVTRQTLKDSLSASLTYQVNTEGAGVELGDEVNFDLSYKYRVFPQLAAGFLFVGLESNVISQGPARVTGEPDLDVGGTRWFLSPSLQYIARKFVLEGAVQIPVVQNVGSEALATDIRLILGGQVNF
ncbi:MAG: transporter [Chloroflexaceae bacterium]|nr:transporter [Chloroflexaceae bacterium]